MIEEIETIDFQKVREDIYNVIDNEDTTEIYVNDLIVTTYDEPLYNGEEKIVWDGDSIDGEIDEIMTNKGYEWNDRRYAIIEEERYFYGLSATRNTCTYYYKKDDKIIKIIMTNEWCVYE